MHSLPDFIRTAAAFLVVLGVLVFVHEMGHYLAARWRGIYVEAFSIGFGRALAGWTDKRGTQWKVAWLPLGGYVRLHGQERPEDVSPAIRAAWRQGETFHEKSVLSRAIVVAAGPIANFVLAMVLFSVLFLSVGQPVAMPIIGEVADGSAAAAGLAVGDRVDAIDGVKIGTFEDVQRIVSAAPGRKLAIQVERAGAPQTLEAVTGTRDDGAGGQSGVLGIRASNAEYRRLGPVSAVAAGVKQTWVVGVETLKGVGQMISGRRGTDDLGGPLRIAQLSGQVAQLGIASLVSLIAVLSVNLGLINLFPIPILDGGHLLFYFCEAVRGRPIPPKAQDIGFRAGMALLACLFVFATWNDLSHFGMFRWVASLIG